MPSSEALQCAACKLLRRKCTKNCAFAPYFPYDEPRKFATAHKVFGASNLARMIRELDASQRDGAVESLLFEAETRIQDPIYGSAGQISILKHRLKQLQNQVLAAKNELSTYIGLSAMMPNLNPESFAQLANMYNIQPTLGVPGPTHENQLVIHEPQQSAVVPVAREQKEIAMRSYEQQQQLLQQQQYQHHPQEEEEEEEEEEQQQLHQQSEIEGLFDGFDNTGNAGQVSASWFIDIPEEGMLPSMDLGSYNNSMYHMPQQQQQQQQQQSEVEGLIDGFDNMENAGGQASASGFNLTEADHMLQSLAFGSYNNSMYNTHEQQQQQPSSEIEWLIDTRNAGQVTDSGLIDLSEEDMFSSLGLDSYNNRIYNTHQQKQQQQPREIEELIDGFDNSSNAGQVSASEFDLTEDDMLQLLAFGSYKNNMYNMHEQQQQQPSSEIEGLIDTRNDGQATASGFIDLTEEDTLSSSLELDSYNNSMYHTHQQQQQQQQQQQYEIEGLFDGFDNMRDAGQVSASGFNLTEDDMLRSPAFGSYNNSMSNTQQQQQQQEYQQQQYQQQQYQHPLQLQADQLLLQRPEQQQLPHTNRDGVEEGGFVGRPPI